MVPEAREKCYPVACKWKNRAKQDFIDDQTFEHYSDSTHYGQVIPSAALAQRMREIVTAGHPEEIEKLYLQIFGTRTLPEILKGSTRSS